MEGAIPGSSTWGDHPRVQVVEVGQDLTSSTVELWMAWGLWALPIIRGPFWSPDNKDHGLVESIWGPLFMETPTLEIARPDQLQHGLDHGRDLNLVGSLREGASKGRGN